MPTTAQAVAIAATAPTTKPASANAAAIQNESIELPRLISELFSWLARNLSPLRPETCAGIVAL